MLLVRSRSQGRRLAAGQTLDGCVVTPRLRSHWVPRAAGGGVLGYVRRVAVRRFHGDLQRVVLRKLVLLDAAETLADLRVPPGNRLEKLHGNRAGQHSIKINDQWRICFRWTKAGPEQVTITDYH